MQPAALAIASTPFNPFSINVATPEKGAKTYSVQRPNAEQVRATYEVAKQIFVEAFSTTYTTYHKNSGDTGTVAQWLKLSERWTQSKDGLKEWLTQTYEDEHKEYLEGKKDFIHLYDNQNKLVGWLSHSPVDEKGDLYLSQCSLEADSRNQRVASTSFTEVLNSDLLHTMFPEAKELKLIARKINTFARNLYEKAHFICDETIDPKVYGDSYDNRYVGYRLPLSR